MGLSKGDGGDMSNWAALLTDLDSGRGNTPDGDGWERMEEIIKKSPFGAVKTRTLMNEALESGEYESYAGSEMGKNKCLVRRIWYRKRDH